MTHEIPKTPEAIDAYRPWCLDSFIRAAEAVLEVCP